MRKALIIAVFLLLTGLPAFFFPKTTVIAEEVQALPTIDNAVQLYYNGKINESIGLLAQITTAYPEDTSARLELIRLLEESGDYPSAIEQLKILENHHPESEESNRVELLKDTILAGRPAAAVQLPLSGEPTAEELYWLGLAYYDLGNYPRALRALHASLDLEAFNPMANFHLGQLYLSISDYDDAQAHLKRALAQEPNLTAAFYPLAQTYIMLGNFKLAQSYLINAVHFFPWDTRIADTLKNLLNEHPKLETDLQQVVQRKMLYTTPPVIERWSTSKDTREIRVGLAEKVQQFFVKTGDRFTLTAPDSPIVYSGEPSAILSFRNTPDGLEVLDEAGKPVFKTSNRAKLDYRNPTATTVLFDVELGPGSFWAGRVDRAYRGRLELIAKPAGTTIVNTLNIEEYLYSVVPSEIPFSWPAESLKAQAIAARTYAIANLGQFDSRGFDLLSTAESQVYSGVGLEKPETTRAVDATLGQILTHQGRPIHAFFSSNNGGFSESPKEMWGLDIPYLRPVPDPMLSPRNQLLPPHVLAVWLNRRPNTYNSNPNFSAKSAYRWVQWVSREEIEYRLNLGNKLGSILSMTAMGRTLSGRVYRLLIKGTNGETILSGEAIRSKLGGLRSNLFVLDTKMGPDGLPSQFIFTGGGWGHGIGLSQSGAAGMAADGYSAEQILASYYPGTVLDRIY